MAEKPDDKPEPEAETGNKITPEQYDEPRAFSEAEIIRGCGSRSAYEEGCRRIARMLGEDEDEAVRRLYNRGGSESAKTADKFLPRRR